MTLKERLTKQVRNGHLLDLLNKLQKRVSWNGKCNCQAESSCPSCGYEYISNIDESVMDALEFAIEELK